MDQRTSIDKADWICAETPIISLMVESIDVTRVKSKTALITDASGVVGRNLAKHLTGLAD